MTISRKLAVINVNTVSDVDTGDNIYSVQFGHYVDKTPDVMSRIPDNLKQITLGNKIGSIELALFLKTEVIPYRVGSKWQLTVSDNGNLNLVEAK